MTDLTRKSFLALVAAGVAMPVLAQQQPAPAAPQAAVIAPAPDAKVMVVGSVVQLRSGGPKMTIIYLANNIATVQWFLDSTGFKKEEFPVAALKLVEDEDEDDEDEDDEDEDSEDEE